MIFAQRDLAGFIYLGMDAEVSTTVINLDLSMEPPYEVPHEPRSRRQLNIASRVLGSCTETATPSFLHRSKLSYEPPIRAMAICVVRRSRVPPRARMRIQGASFSRRLISDGFDVKFLSDGRAQAVFGKRCHPDEDVSKRSAGCKLRRAPRVNGLIGGVKCVKRVKRVR